MKKALKIITLVLTLVICLSVCSCTFINKAKQEAARALDFGEKIAVIAETQDIDKLETLIHPESSISKEYIEEKIRNNEKIKHILDEGIDKDSVTIKSFSEPKMIISDSDLGGNIYGMEATISINDTPISVSITILSTEAGMGFYDFEIK